MSSKTDWVDATKRLLDKYKGKKHPLDYKNTFQLMVMVILSARDSDRHINQVAETLFKEIPNMKVLATYTPETLMPFIEGVRSSGNKANWLIKIAKELKTDSSIPTTLDGLTALPGIGRKSANVILREAGLPAEGIMVDLHTIRVAPRLGIVDTEDPKKIEQQLMEILPRKYWDAGMAMSFLGREICRPKPKCEICFMRDVCEYYKKVISQN
ncbi:MAG: endonuclease III [Chitinophagaceae bacterium]|nr:endonuclease III [Chitinophagaceae bacterium]